MLHAAESGRLTAVTRSTDLQEENGHEDSHPLLVLAPRSLARQSSRGRRRAAGRGCAGARHTRERRQQIRPDAGAARRAAASPFSTPPIRVFIYAGLKTHGEGQHDYPQFLADWSKLLMSRNAIVDGGLHFPSAKELAASDVLVIYKGDAGYLSMEDRANLDAYLRRGGGIVSIHDALCGPDPAYFADIVGGAKKHGEVNYTLEADVPTPSSTTRTRSCRA